MITLRIHRFSLTFALFFGLSSAENLHEPEVISAPPELKIEDILGRSELLETQATSKGKSRST